MGVKPKYWESITLLLITPQIDSILDVMDKHISRVLYFENCYETIHCVVFLPLWAVEFWEAHDRPYWTPQTCHVFEDLKLCDIKQKPRLPVDRNKKQQLVSCSKEHNFSHAAQHIADSLLYNTYLSLFRLTLITSQRVLRLICSSSRCIQCCYANL